MRAGVGVGGGGDDQMSQEGGTKPMYASADKERCEHSASFCLS